MKTFLISIACLFVLSGQTPPPAQATSHEITVTSSDPAVQLEFRGTFIHSEGKANAVFKTPHTFKTGKGAFVLFLSTESKTTMLHGLMTDDVKRSEVNGTAYQMTFYSVDPAKGGGVYMFPSGE